MFNVSTENICTWVEKKLKKKCKADYPNIPIASKLNNKIAILKKSLVYTRRYNLPVEFLNELVYKCIRQSRRLLVIGIYIHQNNK